MLILYLVFSAKSGAALPGNEGFGEFEVLRRTIVLSHFGSDGTACGRRKCKGDSVRKRVGDYKRRGWNHYFV
ncbi:hypothetical protein ACQCVO_23045 [Bacillus infantis]|uniref:hypothetical protein n=1 Tax=Bacillus infantis TaxID=324767 RepID=UPI003CF1AA58